VSEPPLVPEEPVLVDENVLDEFHDAVRSLGPEWQAPSGRRYRLRLSGRRLVVSWPPSEIFSPAPSGAEVDEDLLAMGQAIYNARGGEWAAVRLEQLAAVWSGTNRRDASA
jgi:hypothetical protein